MKHKSYKHIITFFTLCFFGTITAQKFDKKITENFNVNKDVEVEINASNTEINVTTWNKNEVQVEAFIEIEGISKKEVERYFKNWEFEALGNSKTVKITSKANNSFNHKNDFVFFNDMNFTFPEIKMPDFDMIVIPDLNLDFETDLNFDFDFNFEDLDDLDRNMGENGEYEFILKDGRDKIIIKTKKEWEAFKKTKEFKELKEKMAKSKEKMKKRFAESKEKMKKGLAKAKLEYKNIDKEKIKKELAKAKEHIMKMKLNFNSDSDNITINGKKVKIKKRLEIKVPKKATFNLNTRHCKVKLPNTVASGSVKYGTFDANNLIGGKLKIDYSPVNINDLNACTLFLNNVTDAKIASVTNTTLSNNSSGVKIVRINENVNLSDKFGELTISSFKPNFGEFLLNLSHTNATIILGNVGSKFKYDVNRVKLENKHTKTKTTISNNLIKIKGDYSNIVIE